MKIAISGNAGTGKSTLAKKLAKKLGYNYHGMGNIQRKIAKQHGLTIVELGELEKKDSSIDNEIDEMQKKIGETKDNFVIDSWLSAHFIPDAYKIFLYGDIEERAKRIYNSSRKREVEKYGTLNEAISSIQQREKTNRERWIKFYGFDFLDKKNYDFFIDTSGKTPNEVLDLIYNKVNPRL